MSPSLSVPAAPGSHPRLRPLFPLLSGSLRPARLYLTKALALVGLSLLTLCLLCAHTAQAQSGYPGSGSGGSGSGGSYGIWQVTHTASGVDKFDLFDPQGHHSHDEQPWPDHITGVWRGDTTLTASSPFDDALFTWHASGGSPSPYDLSNNLGILSRFLSSISLDMGLYPTSQGLPMTTTVGVKVTSQRDTGPRPGRPL